MLLSQLLKTIADVPAYLNCDISHLAIDSRKIKQGSLFIALKGSHYDATNYIAQAIEQGVEAILVDAASLQDEKVIVEKDVPLVSIFNLQQRVGEIAARFYAIPAKKMYLIGVTGTNGKTSCTHYIAQVLQSLDVPCGMIGTLGAGFYGRLQETGFTTPDALTLQGMLADFVEKDAKAIAMEVSSHSIDQGRINGIPFQIAIFTNLTQDHLDYHGDMKTYAAVKRRFLADFPSKHLIINADDEYGMQFIREFALAKPVYAYRIEKHASFPLNVKVVEATKVDLSFQGIRAEIHSPWGSGELHLPLIGKFNLSNALAVLTALCVYGISFANVLQALSRITAVSGRMQILGGHGKPLVIVDYAHTPDALEKVLHALRAHTQGKLICVFGCGGDRDPGKRPLMAQIAEKLADKIIVTNDNPRHEKPEDIARQIMQGFQHPERVSILLDRSKAIENSIQCASINDCILVAGKGAERYQQIGDEKIPYDDVEKVLHYLECLPA